MPSSRLQKPNKKPNNTWNIPKRIKYKPYVILVMNTDSFINNRIKFVHWITQFIILFKNKILFTNEQNIRKVSQKIGNSSFNSQKLCLNFKSDLNFFRKIFTPIINPLIALTNNRYFWPIRINQFLISFQKKSIIIFIIFLKLNFFLNLILLERLVLLKPSKKL